MKVVFVMVAVVAWLLQFIRSF